MKKQNLLKTFAPYLGQPIKHAPENWATVEEIAAEYGLGRWAAGNLLNKQVESGKLSRQKFRNDDGRVCWFYGVK